MSTKLKTSLAAAASAALLGVTVPASAAQYANVVSATPVTNSVAVPRQDCVQSERLVQAQPSGAGALIGAIAGGVIGNQFGHGFGRAAATGVGAVAGSAIGNNVEANANPPQSVPVQRCRTVNAYESRVVGYDVVYEYNGQRYTTRLPERPGPAPGDRGAPDRQRAARSRRPRRRATAPSRRRPTCRRPRRATAKCRRRTTTRHPRTTTRRRRTTRPRRSTTRRLTPPPYYVAPAAIGLGIGYWIGNTWHRGHRGGWRGHRGRR